VDVCMILLAMFLFTKQVFVFFHAFGMFQTATEMRHTDRFFGFPIAVALRCERHDTATIRLGTMPRSGRRVWGMYSTVPLGSAQPHITKVLKEGRAVFVPN
jgi:hypothetical protein